MIDLHTHILPGIDDGSQRLEESVEMCRLAWESGTRGMVAASHGNGEKGCSLKSYKDAFWLLLQELKKEEIPLEIYPGMEVYMNEEAVSGLEKGELLTLNHTAYVLAEFSFDEELWMMDEYLSMLEDAGYFPVIAHAERYAAVQRHPEAVYGWVNKGYVIQVNKGSFFGTFGKQERDTVLSLLSHNLVHVIASDTHGIHMRTPNMKKILQFLDKTAGMKYRNLVLRENPGRILMGEEILSFPPRPYQ